MKDDRLNSYTDLIKFIEEEVERQYWSREQFCKDRPFHPSQLSLYFRHSREPRFMQIVRLCDELEIEIKFKRRGEKRPWKRVTK